MALSTQVKSAVRDANHVFEVFVSDDCLHCAEAKTYFLVFKQAHPDLIILNRH